MEYLVGHNNEVSLRQAWLQARRRLREIMSRLRQLLHVHSSERYQELVEHGDRNRIILERFRNARDWPEEEEQTDSTRGP
jgi:uncharacterized protein YbcC (UPF0753/DUF2309 family)